MITDQLVLDLRATLEHKEYMEPISLRISKELYKEAKLLERTHGIKKSVYFRYLLKLGHEALENK
jgi:hypothetical protein